MIGLIAQYQFIRYALIAIILASVVCGIVGVITVQKKLTMMAGGIAHSAYGGVGLGYLLGFEPLLGAMLFACIAAVTIAYIKNFENINTDVVISMFWSFGMALGIIFISMMDGYPPDMQSYLFGNILTVSKFDLIIIATLTIIVTLFFIVFFNDYKAYLFDEEYSRIMNNNTKFLDNFLMLLISLTIVVLIKVVGIMLVIALLSIPAAIANLFSKNLKNRMIIAIVVGIIITIIAIFVSIYLDIATSAVIIILEIAVYIILLIFTKIRA